MRLALNDQTWKATRSLYTIFSATLLFAATQLAAATNCGLESPAAPHSLVLAVDRLNAGDYVAFVGALEEEGKSPAEDSLKLASELERYASNGFDECVVAREDVRVNSISLFVVFKSGDQEGERVLYVFFMLAKFGDRWQFIKTQVSTNFDEVYQFVR